MDCCPVCTEYAALHSTASVHYDPNGPYIRRPKERLTVLLVYSIILMVRLMRRRRRREGRERRRKWKKRRK